MIKYKVCQSLSSDMLCGMVEAFLSGGYVLHGGLVVTEDSESGMSTYYQAVIKYIFPTSPTPEPEDVEAG